MAKIMPPNLYSGDTEESSHFIVKMKLEQNKKIIKSSLILVITAIIQELHKDTPLSWVALALFYSLLFAARLDNK